MCNALDFFSRICHFMTRIISLPIIPPTTPTPTHNTHPPIHNTQHPNPTAGITVDFIHGLKTESQCFLEVLFSYFWPVAGVDYNSSFLINSLCHSGFICWYRSGSTTSGSTLVRVMACCLTAPSHYLNQCYLITSSGTLIPGQVH